MPFLLNWYVVKLVDENDDRRQQCNGCKCYRTAFEYGLLEGFFLQRLTLQQYFS